MRSSRAKLIPELVGFSLKNIRRIDFKFDPLSQYAAGCRYFLQEATCKRRLRQSPEIVTRTQVVSDLSDPLVSVQFSNNHKLVLNCKYLEAAHIVKLIKQYDSAHCDDSDQD